MVSLISPFSARRSWNFLVLAVAVLGVSCDSGFKRGQFSVVRSPSFSLSSQPGYFTVLQGHRLAADGQISGPRQDLLYILLVGPIGARNFGIENVEKAHASIVRYTYTTQGGSQDAVVRWDHETDLVTMGKQLFLRATGNVFFVRCAGANKPVGRQFSMLESNEHLLELFRRHLPNDEVIKSLKSSDLDVR